MVGFWEQKWMAFKEDLRRKHPDWNEDRISRTAARKLERAKEGKM